MILKTNSVKILILSFICLLISCESKKSETVNYIAYAKDDTVYLELTRYNDNFYGKLKILGRGNMVVSGDVRGKIIMDTLVGDFYYHPYQTKIKKRKAYVLIDKKDSLIQGTGTESVYMGIPSFVPGSVSFNDPKYVFYPAEQEPPVLY
ncbi:MAG: hypothetical protein RSE50_04010 [Myroides sp.]